LLVKIRFLVFEPISRATFSRAASIAARAARPSLWTEEGFPGNWSARTTTSATSGRRGEVAL
jgi:hypothetical protein